MTNKQKSEEVRKAIRTQVKRIKIWLKVGIKWKGIRYALNLSCNEKTLAYHWRNRGLI